MTKIPYLALISALLLAACSTPTLQPQQSSPIPSTEAPQLANPASQNCIDQGGTLSFEQRGDGGQFGVCTFEDNRQCEEWALMRGDCPVGGVKVTGYATPAGRYCAITGGEYVVMGKSNSDNEQGTCTFPNGTVCEVWDVYNGLCMPPQETEGSIQPLIMEVCNGQAQAMAHFLDVLEVTQSDEPLEDPVTGASGVGCNATVTGSGEQFESPYAVVAILGDMLEEQGWTADLMLAADGPTGTAMGYRKGDQICIAAAIWQPDDSANCPPDQPISACPVTSEQQLYTITLNCGVETP